MTYLRTDRAKQCAGCASLSWETECFSGSVFGYLNLPESLADTDHPNHDEAMGWIGKDFDRTYLDLAEVNAVLSTLPHR
jgi:hypothetical protein